MRWLQSFVNESLRSEEWNDHAKGEESDEKNDDSEVVGTERREVSTRGSRVSHFMRFEAAVSPITHSESPLTSLPFQTVRVDCYFISNVSIYARVTLDRNRRASERRQIDAF